MIFEFLQEYVDKSSSNVPLVWSALTGTSTVMAKRIARITQMNPMIAVSIANNFFNYWAYTLNVI